LRDQERAAAGSARHKIEYGVSSTDLYAALVVPPPQPIMSVTHDAICCGENSLSALPLRYHSLSICDVAEKAQHDPHWPWFLIGVMAPCSRQSTRLDDCE
jgi:hypothetical protein